MRTYYSGNTKSTIILRSGKKVERTIRTNKDGWHYIIYNGYRIGVVFSCGYWYVE